MTFSFSISNSLICLWTKCTSWIIITSRFGLLSSILPTHLLGVAKCNTTYLMCAACLMANADSQTPASPHLVHPLIADAMSLKTDHLQPCQLVSNDHYISTFHGHCPHFCGQNTSAHEYVGGAIYMDHASCKNFHYTKCDMTAPETTHGKQVCEAEVTDLGHWIKAYHSDDYIFASTEFKGHYQLQHQTLSLSLSQLCWCSSSKQDSRTCIKTTSQLSQQNLVHLMIYWPEHCNIEHRSQASYYELCCVGLQLPS